MSTNHTPGLMVGTGNAHKLLEISRILDDLELEVVDTRVLPEIPDVEESGDTFEANSTIKALAFAESCLALAPGDRPRWVLSDDSGLCVDALDGRPGVLSARYASDRVDTPNDTDNVLKLLDELEDVPDGQRSARFVCHIVVVQVPESSEHKARIGFSGAGECHGVISRTVQGEGGFGYDPVFEVPDLGKTFAEIPGNEKNRRSHRGRALALLREYMQEQLGQKLQR